MGSRWYKGRLLSDDEYRSEISEEFGLFSIFLCGCIGVFVGSKVSELLFVKVVGFFLGSVFGAVFGEFVKKLVVMSVVLSVVVLFFYFCCYRLFLR